MLTSSNVKASWLNIRSKDLLSGVAVGRHSGCVVLRFVHVWSYAVSTYILSLCPLTFLRFVHSWAIHATPFKNGNDFGIRKFRERPRGSDGLSQTS